MKIKYLFTVLLLFFTGCEEKTSNKTLSDPLFEHQWYLQNSGQPAGAANGGSAGEDIHIGTAWEITKGAGIKLAIVDTGIERSHPDLCDNVDTTLSATYYNAYVISTDPSPTPDPPTEQLEREPVDSAHGTACAGIAAAVADNGIGIKGVAPRATLVGLNTFADTYNNLSQPQSFADALYNPDRPIDISSNSWNDIPGGLSDTSVEIAAIRNGALTGRNGKGTVYCFAAGNERYSLAVKSDNANWYRELNTPYVITVAALNARGRYAGYSNFGANILISGYGGEGGVVNPAIVTTDLSGAYGFDSLDPDLYQNHFDIAENGNADYTNTMNGTSAATPMLAGVTALVLGANPNLTYRDVRYILATTARKNDQNNSDWLQNGAGRWVNHNYGFGAVDTEAAVLKAVDFEGLEANTTRTYDSGSVSLSVPDKGILEQNITVPEEITIEHVELYLQLGHDYPGDLNITLTSPQGTPSLLTHTNTALNGSGYENFFYDFRGHDGFTLGSVRCLDENSSGVWQLKIDDTVEHTVSSGGTLFRYKLIIYGREP